MEPEINLLFFQGFAPPVLVFVQSIERAKELFHELIYEGINVDVIHADKTQQQVGGFYFFSINALERKVKARVSECNSINCGSKFQQIFVQRFCLIP